MDKAFGMLAAFVGVGVGWLLLTSDEGDRRAADRLASVVRIAVDGAAMPRQPALQPASHPVSGEGIEARVRTPVPRRSQAELGHGDRAPAGDWRPSRDRVAANPAHAEAQPVGPGVRPPDDDARRVLTRAIQGELKRLGCYDGLADGSWSPATRRAMGTFNERVNASLPIDEPDYILLTLLQGQSGRVCDRSCPSGQVLLADGRCTPRAVMAYSDRRREPLPGRMDAGAPMRDPAADALRGREGQAAETRRAAIEAADRQREALEQQKADAARARAAAEEAKRADAAERARQAAERAEARAAEERRKQEALVEDRLQKAAAERERLEAKRAAQVAARQQILEAAERVRSEAAEARRRQLAESEERKARLALEARERAQGGKHASVPPVMVAAADSTPAISVTQSNASTVVSTPAAAGPSSEVPASPAASTPAASSGASGATIAGATPLAAVPPAAAAPATASPAATSPVAAPTAAATVPPAASAAGAPTSPDTQSASLAPASGAAPAVAAPSVARKPSPPVIRRREARGGPSSREATRAAYRFAPPARGGAIRVARAEGPRPSFREAIFRSIATHSP